MEISETRNNATSSMSAPMTLLESRATTSTNTRSTLVRLSQPLMRDRHRTPRLQFVRNAADEIGHRFSFRANEALHSLVERKCFEPMAFPKDRTVQEIGCRSKDQPSPQRLQHRVGKNQAEISREQRQVSDIGIPAGFPELLGDGVQLFRNCGWTIQL